MNALTAPRKRRPNLPYPPGLTLPELLAEWETRLSVDLVEHPSGCVEWVGPDRDGRGGLTCPAPRILLSSILAGHASSTVTVVQALWIIKHSEAPARTLCRTCRHPWCVAPEHHEYWSPERLRRQRLENQRRYRARLRAGDAR